MTTILTTITWQGKTGYFLDPGNWSLGVIPGTGDTALFGASGVTDISIVSPSIPSPFSAPFLVGAEDWSFSPVASNYNFGIGFKVTLEFDHGAITVTGGSAHLFNFGELDFDFSSSGQAPITNFNLLGFAGPGSTAGNSIIDTVGGARTAFATLSTGGSAQFITEAGGVVDFSLTSGPGDDGRITAGSIAGAGTYKLGFNHLIVGSNGLSTTVSGPIDDGGAGSGSGGSLDKVGRGTLTLSGAGNTYSGGTKLEAGTLDVAAVGAAGTGAIGFAGKATLKIENAALSGHVFATNIVFFAKHDVLDLTELKFHHGAKATYHKVTNLLTVHSGHVTDTLTLLPPHGTHFAVANDGHGGTMVTLAPLQGGRGIAVPA